MKENWMLHLQWEAGIVQLIQWLGYGLDDRSSVHIGDGEEILFSSLPRQGWLWGPPRLLCIGVPAALSPGCEADHSSPSSAEVNWGAVPTLSIFMALCPIKQGHIISWYFVKHEENFTFLRLPTVRILPSAIPRRVKDSYMPVSLCFSSLSFCIYEAFNSRGAVSNISSQKRYVYKE
jgi:hypothetical protein